MLGAVAADCIRHHEDVPSISSKGEDGRCCFVAAKSLELVDGLVLMERGHILYCGARRAVTSFLSGRGMESEHSSPAELIQRVLGRCRIKETVQAQCKPAGAARPTTIYTQFLMLFGRSIKVEMRSPIAHPRLYIPLSAACVVLGLARLAVGVVNGEISIAEWRPQTRPV